VTRRLLAVVVLAVAMTGCTTKEPVMMYNPESREIARCAEARRSFMAGDGYRAQDDCIADYEKQGFQRMSAPAGTR
jgi:outer membrane PBP1 activator LpoA protein